MATLDQMTDRLRLELGDFESGFRAEVTSDGSTQRYTLPVEMVSTSGFSAYPLGSPGSPYVLDTDFTMDFRAGVLTFDAGSIPTSGTVVVIEGNSSDTFTDTDLETFVNTAFTQHAHQRTDEHGIPLTLANIPAVEEYPVVILAQVEALWALVTDTAQEIDVRNPDGVNIPVGQRYEQLLGLIAAKREQYKELSAALNVGLHRIEMFTLRRVSRSTNRLVPVYKSEEYDHINKGFTPDHGPVGTTVVIRGENFTEATDVTFGGVSTSDLTIVSDSVIFAEVPGGAVTGKIVVTTPDGEVESHYEFTVGGGVPTILHGAAGQRVYPPIDDNLS